MSSWFNSDFGCVSVRTKLSDPRMYGAQPRPSHPLALPSQRSSLCLLSVGIDPGDEVVSAPRPDLHASLWRADGDPAYLESVDQAGVRVQHTAEVRYHPLASLSSGMRQSRAPRPPPSTLPQLFHVRSCRRTKSQ